jgi:hypothetical protein
MECFACTISTWIGQAIVFLQFPAGHQTWWIFHMSAIIIPTNIPILVG